MRVLAYYTVGYQSTYITPMALSIKSLRHFHPDITVWVLCDEKLVEKVWETIPDITIHAHPNSATPENASMQKLSIFDHDLTGFDKVIYIDADILVGIPIIPLLERVTNPDKIYVYKEKDSFMEHNQIYWSLRSYTRDDIKYFIDNNIFVFNAGLFSFIPSAIMQAHFNGVRELVRTHKGTFFYEQSFMNVYFNKRNLADYSIFIPSNYSMHATISAPSNTILHFCGSPGDGSSKLTRMTDYASRYMPYLLT